MKYAANPTHKDKPIVLLVLAGAHQLDLFKSILAGCGEFDWVVYIQDINAVPETLISDLNARYGTQFFTDKASALAHFGTIDAVVTTFAVPHLAHLHYLDFTALAYEMNLPVFELQHGLFQIGMSIQEHSPLVGSGHRSARNALPGPNLVSAQMRWFGADAIGYPPFSPENHFDAGYFGDFATAPSAPDKILFTTNFHWNLLTDAEKEEGYKMMVKAIISLPDCLFTISPHPAEMSARYFVNMLRRLEESKASNYRIVRPSSPEERLEMLRETKLAISSISTVLLDLEMLKIPTFLFGFDSFRNLIDSFDEVVTVSDPRELVLSIKDAVFLNRMPTLISGKLHPFDPTVVTQKIRSSLTQKPLDHARYIPLINKYIRQVS